MSQLIRVINARETFLVLPAFGRPSDKDYLPERTLIPGANNLEAAHVKGLDANTKGLGNVWRMWKEAGWIRVLSAEASKAEVKRPEGPEAPVDLSELRFEGAEVLISLQTDAAILARWMKREKRQNVKDLIRARLVTVGQTPEPPAGGPEPTPPEA